MANIPEIVRKIYSFNGTNEAGKNRYAGSESVTFCAVCSGRSMSVGLLWPRLLLQLQRSTDTAVSRLYKASRRRCQKRISTVANSVVNLSTDDATL